MALMKHTDTYDITCKIGDKVTLEYDHVTYEESIKRTKEVAHLLNLDQLEVECLKQFVSF